MRNKNLIKLVYAALIAAIYVVLTLLLKPISFGVIQFRLSEVLAILPVFTISAVPGLFVGCLLANYLSGAALLDIIFGSLATLIGAYGTYILRKKVKFASLPPIVANALIIPFVLRYAYGVSDLIIFMMFTIFISEVLAIAVLGNLLRILLNRYKNIIFKDN